LGAGGGEGLEFPKRKGTPDSPWGPGVAGLKKMPSLFSLSILYHFFHKFLLAKIFIVTVCILFAVTINPEESPNPISTGLQPTHMGMERQTPARNPRTIPLDTRLRNGLL